MLSDTHSFHREIIVPECDLLLYAGDFTNAGDALEVVDFVAWLQNLPCKHIVFIAGNHDLTTELKKPNTIMDNIHNHKSNNVKAILKRLPSHIHYLENSEVEIEGLKIWGSPISPTFGYGWAWNRDRGEEISKTWSKIPKDVNILLTHTPPYGIFDWVDERYKRYPDEDQHVGCKDLLDRIKKLPKLHLHVFGHIHDQIGLGIKKITNTKKGWFCNPSAVDNQYKVLINKPLIIEL